MKTICLVGCGKMGSAMLSGWHKDSGLRAEFHVIEPLGPAHNDRPGTFFYAAPEALPTDFSPDLVVLAVKPQMMKEALSGLAGVGNGKTCWLSIAAGLSTSVLGSFLGRPARWLRAMPNTPAAIGQGISALYANADVPEDVTALSEQLLSACGPVVRLEDEALMNAVTALSGSGPAYVFLLTEVMAAAGERLGLESRLSYQLARQTVSGSGALMAADSQPASVLRENVTSKGGTTAAALSVLMNEGRMQQLFDEALAAAARRAEELDSQG